MGVWVDTDMSADDFFALRLLGRHAEIDGISLRFGVVPLPRVRADASAAAAVFGWRFPIHAGADRAVLGGAETAERILGHTGIRSRGLTLPEAPDSVRPDAIGALARWLEGREGAEILALGPLTNLAALALTRPADPPPKNHPDGGSRRATTPRRPSSTRWPPPRRWSSSSLAAPPFA